MMKLASNLLYLVRQRNVVKKLHPGDKIIGVGQATGDIEDVVGWRLEDLVEKIKGKKALKFA